MTVKRIYVFCSFAEIKPHDLVDGFDCHLFRYTNLIIYSKPQQLSVYSYALHPKHYHPNHRTGRCRPGSHCDTTTSFFFEPKAIIPQKAKPNGSPLEFCNELRVTSLYRTESIELYPNPLHM